MKCDFPAPKSERHGSGWVRVGWIGILKGNQIPISICNATDMGVSNVPDRGDKDAGGECLLQQ